MFVTWGLTIIKLNLCSRFCGWLLGTSILLPGAHQWIIALLLCITIYTFEITTSRVEALNTGTPNCRIYMYILSCVCMIIRSKVNVYHWLVCSRWTIIIIWAPKRSFPFRQIRLFLSNIMTNCLYYKMHDLNFVTGAEHHLHIVPEEGHTPVLEWYIPGLWRGHDDVRGHRC